MDIVLFAIFFIACAGAGATGALFAPGSWYKLLDKPAWTPPDWVFPVAWTILYVCIAAAGARTASLPGNGVAMALLAAQFSFNALWTPVFFGLRRMAAGFLVVAVLWFLVAATMVAFFQLDRVAGWLFVPYLVWVTVAAALNFAVWRMNPGVPALDPSEVGFESASNSR